MHGVRLHWLSPERLLAFASAQLLQRSRFQAEPFSALITFHRVGYCNQGGLLLSRSLRGHWGMGHILGLPLYVGVSGLEDLTPKLGKCLSQAACWKFLTYVNHNFLFVKGTKE